MAVLLLSALPLFSHNPRRGRPERYIRRARVIAVVVIRKVRVVENKCSVTTVVNVSLRRVIKGRLPRGVRLHYQYTDYIWRRGCPSVHYRYGPRAMPLKRGKEIIVTAGTGFPGWKGWWITSSYNMDQMERVKRLVKK